MPGGRVSFAGNLFYSAMHDAQRELDFPLGSPAGEVGLLQIISEPRAHSYGAELELSARLSPTLTVASSVGLLRTRITKGIAPDDPFIGKEFAGAPHFTGSASVDWQPVRNLHLSAQARHNSGYWGDDYNDPLFRTSGWSMVDARVSWSTGRYTVFGYAQNVFDTLKVLGWTGPRNLPFVEVGLTDPRELGVGIDARF